MRVGVFLVAARFPGQSDDEVLAAAVQAAVAAERAGFDDVWLAEHHFMSYGICPSAVTLAGYVLGQTQRVEVGTAVSVLSAWHPVALAEQAALLDQVSAGRFRLGVGRGGPWLELEVFGTGLDRYERGFAEGLDLLLAALSRGRVAAAGEFFQFREVAVVPHPRTRPHPPVVVAATAPATAKLAAARGLPVLLGLHADDEGKQDMMACYAAAAARHGVVPTGGHVAAVVAQVADTRAEARRLLRTQLPRWLGPGLAGYVPVDGRPRPARDPGAYAELLCRIHPVGTAADCAETMAATARRTGIDHLICMVEGSGDPAAVQENIARLGAEVLPRLPGRGDSPTAPDTGTGASLPLAPGSRRTHFL
jgi:alkanesulfonate monooxygenase SsuD/methylene tetrahydromethanopterin reductase-like flavin-dependent oxidoreductase (luciferase family)